MAMPACARTLLSAALVAALGVGGLQLFAQQGSAPPADPKSAAPAPTPAKAKAAPADENAFPEAESEAAQKQATEQEGADRKAASTGSAVGSAPGEASSSRDKFAGVDLLGDHDARIANGAGGTVVDAKLSAQDLKVGQQYMGMGNYQGAYERFKEACTVNPGNVDAVFYLAEAARKTAHLDESAENYKVYLQVQPDGSKAKAARKALTQLQGK